MVQERRISHKSTSRGCTEQRFAVSMDYSSTILFVVALILTSAHLVLSERWCDASALEQCALFESCVVAPNPLRNSATQHLNGTCHCLKNYQRSDNGDCIRTANLDPGHAPLKGHSASASAVAAGVLVPVTLIAAVGALVYFGRRYQWLEKLRQPPVRQYDTVLIGSQMDGDDDPPIS